MVYAPMDDEAGPTRDAEAATSQSAAQDPGEDGDGYIPPSPPSAMKRLPLEHEGTGSSTGSDEGARLFDNEEEDGHHHSLPIPEALLGERRLGEGEDDIECDSGEATLMQTIAGVAGNVLEWYDFAVFGAFGDVIGEVFFPPNQEGHAALAESFAVFGGAFIMRPVGGCLMGWIGDKYGRKRALQISIFLMAFPTFAMGCLPSYEAIGGWAVALLAIVRCLQGLSVGGQLMSSLVFTLEKHHKAHWGLYGAYVMAAANVGTLLGGVVSSALRSWLTEEQLRIWGWRLPFLGGILVSLTGVYLKYHCEDDHPGQGSSGNPLKAAFSRENRRALLSATLVPMLWSGGFYLTFVWMSIFMSELEDPPVPEAFLVNSLSLLCSVCLLFPLAGLLSDKIGRRITMAIGGVCLVVLSPPLVFAIGRGNPFGAFLAQSALGIGLCLWGAPMMAWLVEAFPPAARLTSVSIGYNIAQALSGGFAPAIATVLVDKVGKGSPGFILSILAATSVLGLLIAPPQADGVEATRLEGEREDDERERIADAVDGGHEVEIAGEIT